MGTVVIKAKHECVFSEDMRYRYVLKCRVEQDLFASTQPERWLMTVGLNPSTADQNSLDRTLNRIYSFMVREHFTGFWMGNLFGYRATYPKNMKAQNDPIGPDNDYWLMEGAKFCDTVLAAWGDHGDYLDRDRQVLALLRDAGTRIVYLEMTKRGLPRHPLYIRADTPFKDYPIAGVSAA